MVIIHHKMRPNMAIISNKMDEKWNSSITICHMDILINIFLVCEILPLRQQNLMLLTKMTFVKKNLPKLPSLKEFFFLKSPICRQ